MIKIQRRPESDLAKLPANIAPLLRRIYLNRGITNTQQLDNTAKSLHSYQNLAGIEKAVSLLYDAVCNNERIIIVGDFDVDGATSSALSARSFFASDPFCPSSACAAVGTITQVCLAACS